MKSGAPDISYLERYDNEEQRQKCSFYISDEKAIELRAEGILVPANTFKPKAHSVPWVADGMESVRLIKQDND